MTLDIRPLNAFSTVAINHVSDLNDNFDRMRTVANVKHYGAKGDAMLALGYCSMAASSNILTIDTTVVGIPTKLRFKSSDVGKVVMVEGAGALIAGYRQPLCTTIAGFVDATHVTLAANAVATVTHSDRTVWGTNDENAIKAALEALTGVGAIGELEGGILWFPAGHYLGILDLPFSKIGTWCYGIGTKTYNNITIRGEGMFNTLLEEWNATRNVPDGSNYPGGGVLSLGRAGGSIAQGIAAPGTCYDGNRPLYGTSVEDIGFRMVKHPTYSRVCVFLGQCDHTRFKNVMFSGPSHEGLYTGYGHNTEVIDCYAEDCGHGGPAYTFSTSGFNFISNYVRARGLRASNCGQAVEMGAHHQSLQGFHFSNCPLGINIGSVSRGIWDVAVQNGIIEDCPNAIVAENSLGLMADVRLQHISVKNGYVSLAAGRIYNDVEDVEESSTGKQPARNIINGLELHYTAGYGGTRGMVVGDVFDYPLNPVSVKNIEFSFEDAPTPRLNIARCGGADKWQPSHNYTASTSNAAVPDFVLPLIKNGYIYRCTTTGTSGTAEPTWPTSVGNTVADNTCVWTCYGKAPLVSISAVRWNGPEGYVPAVSNNSPLVIQGYGTMRYLKLTDLACNFPWFYEVMGVASKVEGESTPVEAYAVGDATGMIPAGAVFGEADRWWEPGTNGDGLSQSLPWAGYFQRGTWLKRVKPVTGAGGLGYVVTRAGYAARPWRLSGAGNYSTFGEFVVPSVDNGHVYMVTVTGAQSASTEPVWPTGSGSTVTSGAVTFKEVGASAVFTAYP